MEKITIFKLIKVILLVVIIIFLFVPSVKMSVQGQEKKAHNGYYAGYVWKTIDENSYSMISLVSESYHGGVAIALLLLSVGVLVWNVLCMRFLSSKRSLLMELILPVIMLLMVIVAMIGRYWTESVTMYGTQVRVVSSPGAAPIIVLCAVCAMIVFSIIQYKQEKGEEK